MTDMVKTVMLYSTLIITANAIIVVALVLGIQ